MDACRSNFLVGVLLAYKYEVVRRILLIFDNTSKAFVASLFRGIFGAFRRSDFLQLCRYMLAKIYSAAVYGVDAYEVEIEVNGAGGDPVIVIVGLPDAAVKESRDRVTTAISNSGYYWPRGRTTINLAPADIKKEGPSFDLPIALGMIAVTEELDSSPFENFSFVGELALDGSRSPRERRAAGRARGATPRQTRVVRPRSKCARSRDGRQD